MPAFRAGEKVYLTSATRGTDGVGAGAAAVLKPDVTGVGVVQGSGKVTLASLDDYF